MKELIRKHGWKSVQIKWGGQEAKGAENWDFALARTNNGKTAQQYCNNQGFTTPVNSDWTTVYRNLGWNVETKQVSVNGNGKTETKICI